MVVIPRHIHAPQFMRSSIQESTTTHLDDLFRDRVYNHRLPRTRVHKANHKIAGGLVDRLKLLA